MPDACPVGEAADGDAALRLVAELAPDVVLMDLHVPGVGGVEATRAITQRHPDTALVVLTMLQDDGSMLAAMRAGARGYLLKGADEAEIAATVRVVAAGGAVFGPDIAARALASVRAGPNLTSRAFADLSERETDILDLLARGLSNVAIAAELHLSHQTVRNYVSSIYTKLGATDRADAIIQARNAGVGRDDTR
jgi:DNA-binding NarL/FixJ family response regulator